MKIVLDLDKTLEENAGGYFDKAKKARKKIDGARKAVELAKVRLEKSQQKKELEEKKQFEAQAQRSRKKAWYEKFRWFFTSDGLLVISGKDASSNEVVIKKHAEKDDLVFHTDMAGSPFTVLKNPGGKEVPVLSRDEAAVFTATFSKAWVQGLRYVDVFEVNPGQVTKEARAGEYVAKGSFMVYGKRKNHHASLSLAIGLYEGKENPGAVMSGPESAVRKHCSKHVSLKQGSSKKGDISKKIMKYLGLHSNDDVLASVPSGGFDIQKDKK